MNHVTSPDGSRIAYDQAGAGDPVILIDGALCSRELGPFPPAVAALADRFTVIHYDRRGRGDSSDASNGGFEIAREVEDLRALVEQVGGRPSLVGMSSGGALAIEAANALTGIRQVVVYEVPFITDPGARMPADYAQRMRELVRADRRSEAVRLFLRTVGMPPPMVQLMRVSPPFRKLKRVAHTLPYDAALIDDPLGPDRRLPEGRWTSIEAPVTVLAGGKSPPSMREANADLAKLLGAEHRTVEGATHMIKGPKLAAVLAGVLDRG
jgi:pimeloyl-ACP methyl ester carboxylesterase